MARDLLQREQNSYVSPLWIGKIWRGFQKHWEAVPGTVKAAVQLKVERLCHHRPGWHAGQATFGRVTLPHGALHNSGRNWIVVTTSFTNRLQEMPAFVQAWIVKENKACLSTREKKEMGHFEKVFTENPNQWPNSDRSSRDITLSVPGNKSLRDPTASRQGSWARNCFQFPSMLGQREAGSCMMTATPNSSRSGGKATAPGRTPRSPGHFYLQLRSTALTPQGIRKNLTALLSKQSQGSEFQQKLRTCTNCIPPLLWAMFV